VPARRLPALYAQAGVPELWLVDARGDTPACEVWGLKAGRYEQIAADGPPPNAWTSSPVLGCRFRLQRRVVREGHFVYNLEASSLVPPPAAMPGLPASRPPQ
jgi:hypothetical protein